MEDRAIDTGPGVRVSNRGGGMTRPTLATPISEQQDPRDDLTRNRGAERERDVEGVASTGWSGAQAEYGRRPRTYGDRRDRIDESVLTGFDAEGRGRWQLVVIVASEVYSRVRTGICGVR